MKPSREKIFKYSKGQPSYSWGPNGPSNDHRKVRSQPELSLAWHETDCTILGLYWGYIGIMEKKRETTIVGYLGIMSEDRLHTPFGCKP